jgi:Uma2 family endonuclease
VEDNGHYSLPTASNERRTESTVIQETNLYQLLPALPENLVGEIIDGQLYTQPRRAGPHASTSSVLGMEIGTAYRRGRGGAAGWWIIDEPELHFLRDTEVLVPDIAGWRRERMAVLPEDHRFGVVPDWVCEVLSPATPKRIGSLRGKCTPNTVSRICGWSTR